MSPAAIAGLILAGGASSRIGSPKSLLRVGGETFLDRLIAVFASVCDPVVVVLGHDADRVRQGIEHPGFAAFTVNPDPDRGMLSSLQCGLLKISATSPVIFTPVDYPGFRQTTLARIAAALNEGSSDVVIPLHYGCKGHPVGIASPVVRDLLALPCSAQARDVIRQYRDRTRFVEVDDPGIVADIDTPADYANFVTAGLAGSSHP